MEKLIKQKTSHKNRPFTKYRVAIRFGEEPDTMPYGWKFGRVSGVATDSQNEVYVIHRGENGDQLIVFTSDGKYLRSWGKNIFATPHGLRIDKYDNIWVIDSQNHQVFKFTRNGKLLMSLGINGKPGMGEKMFNSPTDIAFTVNDDFYISDGYFNSRVVKFDKHGNYLMSWGRRGSAPGEFYTVHSIAVDSKSRVIVSDRENNRIQIFTSQGEFLTQWNHLGATQGLFITPNDELWIVTQRKNFGKTTYDTLSGRIMNVDIETGNVIGIMECPGHMLTVSRRGDIFVASLTGNVFRWYPVSEVARTEL